VFELVGEMPAAARADRAAAGRLVGRAKALASLETALARALDGDGLALGVEGAPGVGKSRLCREFAARCRWRGLRVAEAHCASHARTLAHLAMFELLRSFFGADDDPDRAAARRRVEAHCAELPEAGVALGDLLEGLGLSESGGSSAGGDPSEHRRHVEELACAAIRRSAEREQVVLWIDDVHWIDAASEAFVARLVDSLAGTRALLVVSHRADYRAPWMEHRSVYHLGLGPLDRKASIRLVRDRVGSDPSAHELAGLVYERVGGNPLFLEEWVRSLLESGRLAGEPGAYVWVDPLRELAIPPTIRAVIAARIDRLATPHKRVLQAASVIGRRFERRVLERVAGVGDDLESSLRALEEAEFVRRETPYQPDEYAFKHALTQEVSYASLLSERRAELHAAVAEALAEGGERLGARAELIAQHWEAADRPRDARLWRYRMAYRVTNLVPRRNGRPRPTEA